MIRKVKQILKFPDYEIIFLLYSNKIPIRELFRNYVKFLLKKNVVLSHGRKLRATRIYIRMRKLCATCAERVADSINNSPAPVWSSSRKDQDIG